MLGNEKNTKSGKEKRGEGAKDFLPPVGIRLFPSLGLVQSSQQGRGQRSIMEKREEEMEEDTRAVKSPCHMPAAIRNLSDGYGGVGAGAYKHCDRGRRLRRSFSCTPGPFVHGDEGDNVEKETLFLP